jgi:hypothetical protein
MKKTCNPSVPDFGQNENRSHRNPICPKCGNSDIATGAGRRPGEMSVRCARCKCFIKYLDTKNLTKLKKPRKKKDFTGCVQFIERSAGLHSDVALYVLIESGEVGGES